MSRVVWTCSTLLGCNGVNASRVESYRSFTLTLGRTHVVDRVPKGGWNGIVCLHQKPISSLDWETSTHQGGVCTNFDSIRALFNPSRPHVKYVTSSKGRSLPNII